MSDEPRKTNKQSTGTVPKVKYRNNTSCSINEHGRSRGLTNNLTTYSLHPLDTSNFIRNPKRKQRNNYFIMDATLEEATLNPIQNGAISFNQHTNGTVTPDTSSSTSRRNSCGSTLKCDNVMKYPDKKQIEDKLHQIREYLKVTNSLMTSMKNTDDQTSQAEKENLKKMINDLKDSDLKLTNILDQLNCDEIKVNSSEQLMDNGIDNLSEHSVSSFRKNELGINLDNPNQEIDTLKDQQMDLMKLQQKAENKLKDARQIQTRLLTAHYENDVKGISNHKDNKNYLEHDYDATIKELEERARRLRPPQLSNQKLQDNILAKVESLHNQIISMHNANDEREQLIEALDNRDVELRSQHVELQNKLLELQNKKLQVDQLVAQIQNFADEDEDDVGGQVRRIVTMKDQLKKLKDMLEIVKTTENIMQNTNAPTETQVAGYDICLPAENSIDKDMHKSKLQPHSQNENNVLRHDSDSVLINDSQPKEVNKKARDQCGRGMKPRAQSINEKLALQAQLEAKKKELEEIMGKHKASTSNLNHDVGVDIKSELSCTSNTVNEAWIPLIPPHNHRADSDRFSSDDCQDEVNDYAELHDNHNVLPLTTSNFFPSNSTKYRSENNPRSDYIPSSEFDRLQNLSRTSDRNIRSGSIATSGYIREQPQTANEEDSRMQIQKQLQLIKSVCDSMLEQQTITNSSSNAPQLRNNLTPSPLYSEPRRFASPNPHVMNALNVINPTADMPFFAGNNMHSNLNSDINNYQSWLATNTIQTQSVMLNTLNQCCQMLWLQQKELVSLRNSVSMLQERIENNPYGGTQGHLAPIQPTSQDHISTSHYRPIPNQKVNHVSAAFSLPNLNQYNTPPNPESNYINQNNLQSDRLLDPCLNNVNVNHLNVAQGIEHANNVLHGVNSTNNHTLPNQMWNGQALNNQVAPGNRANNYWDNFRSYSRQNLFSTKNSEVLQNSPALGRSNTLSDRTDPFTIMSFSKSNSKQDSANTSRENTPQRRISLRSVRCENTSTSVIPPPDVLNINHNLTKVNEQSDLSCFNTHDNDDMNLGFQMLLNLNASNETCSNHSNISEEHVFKECNPEQSRRRNEWREEVREEYLPKTKLFEELRENVYKEVASLISANETRPHFLIQLFRDLQLIASDSLRLKILQSVQMVITHSLISPQNTSRYDSGTEIHDIFKGALPFLNDHEDEVIHSALMTSLKRILLDSEAFKEIVKDTVFQKHFSNVLDEALEQYRGKKVCDNKVHLIQTLNNLLCGELSFIQLIQETNPENCLSRSSNGVEQASATFTLAPVCELQSNNCNGLQVVENNIQNGDLAEADQSRILDDDTEEEGAVGGVLETTEEIECNQVIQTTCEDIETATMDFPCSVEGLDQIPTRLPTKGQSRSTTPNRDRSNTAVNPDPF